jgi:hypothetical protein
MYPTKAPGLMGSRLTSSRGTGTCGEEVTNAVLWIIKGDESLEVIMKTFIMMIPKLQA